MQRLARFIVQKRLYIFLVFAVLIVLSVICIPKVKVEYDISTYLPKNTDTKRALDIMEDEFVTYGSTTVMVKNISFENAQKLHDEIASVKVDGRSAIRTFSFENSPEYYKNNCAKFTITYDGTAEDERAVKAYDRTVAILDASGYSYCVPTPLVDSYADTLAHEMIIIIAISAGVILLVLLFTSKSFAEVIAFPIVFVVAALLNMGTNFLFGTISFVSNTVCIILQLALAIDYAIILCHRFTEEKEKHQGTAEKALISALSKAIPEIASSSLTTVSGLVALMFMQLRLGLDLGMVLAKSIICSLITVFFLMPGILLYLSKLMDRTRHRNFVPKLKFWGAGMIKARYVLIAAFIALFACGAALSQRIDYCYNTDSIDTSRPTATLVATRECEEVFGYSNTFAILVPSGDTDMERRVLDLVESDPMINSATGFANINYKGVYLVDKITSGDFAKLTGISPYMAMTLFNMYAQSTGESWTTSYSVRLIDLLDFISENEATLRPFLDSSSREMLATVKSLIAFARAQLVGENYSRLVFNINGPIQSDDTFAMIDRLTPAVKEICPQAIFAGPSMTAYDLNASFSSDNIIITLLTIAFIFLILMITFRSPCIPVVLVLVIQGAIFMNFSLPVLMHRNMFFFTYLIISAIQMGATIDYAILLTNRFNSLKAHLPKRQALIEAVSGAFPTVFTSGTIMCVAGFLVGRLTSDPLISSMGTSLGTGTIISILSVLTVLPALLYTLDPLLKRTVLKPRRKAKHIHMPDPSEIPFE